MIIGIAGKMEEELWEKYLQNGTKSVTQKPILFARDEELRENVVAERSLVWVESERF